MSDVLNRSGDAELRAWFAIGEDPFYFAGRRSVCDLGVLPLHDRESSREYLATSVIKRSLKRHQEVFFLPGKLGAKGCSPKGAHAGWRIRRDASSFYVR